MKTRSFKQEVIIYATPEKVYNTLVDPDEHAAFTGGEALYTDSSTRDFSIYDGYIVGRNLELIPGKKIRQTWQAAEPGWPEDHYSEVIYELEPHAEGTLLKFTHNDVPVAHADDIYQGWYDHYWEPLNEYLVEM